MTFRTYDEIYCMPNSFAFDTILKKSDKFVKFIVNSLFRFEDLEILGVGLPKQGSLVACVTHEIATDEYSLRQNIKRQIY